jgi:hypothetical protein
MAGAFSLLRGDDQTPANCTLRLRMLVTVLWWQWISTIRCNFSRTALALKDARVWDRGTWPKFLVERQITVLSQYLRILVKRHLCLSCAGLERPA